MPIEVFYSYAHEDELLRKQLENHLASLHRSGLISSWHDRQIVAGQNWAQVIDDHLETASLILLLVSSNFLASDYCYGIEMQRALERHRAKKALVIPLLLRPVDLDGMPFEHLQALPTNAIPVTEWKNSDTAFRDIAAGIRRAIKNTQRSSASNSSMLSSSTLSPSIFDPSPKTLRCRRTLLIAGLGTGLAALAGGIVGWILPHPSPLPPICVPSQIASNGLLTPGVLSWGADPTGGAPYAFLDANNTLIGFEVDIANALAHRMGISQECHQTSYKWAIEQDLRARKMDVILNGWEITPNREIDEAFSTPYYRYRQQLVVRTNDARFSQYTASSPINLSDLASSNYKFGTGTDYKAADEFRTANITPITSATPLNDLKNGAVDVVMIDEPLVIYYVEGKGKGATADNTLRRIGQPLFPSNYVIGFKKNDPNADTLRQEINQALLALKLDGTLKRIYQQWGLWNDSQKEVDVTDLCS